MKHLNPLLRLFACSLMLLAFAGCGNNTDPLTVIGSANNGAQPQLDSIVPQTGSFTSLVTGFSASSPYWVLGGGGTGFGGNYIAPANGQVLDIGTTVLNGSTVTYVTILHSGGLATRVYGIQSVSVRSYDYVSAGQIIGTYIAFTGSNEVAFQVLLNDVPQCPLSYMSTAFRDSFLSLYGTNLCL